jgi:hypothetical protein
MWQFYVNKCNPICIFLPNIKVKIVNSTNALEKKRLQTWVRKMVNHTDKYKLKMAVGGLQEQLSWVHFPPT